MSRDTRGRATFTLNDDDALAKVEEMLGDDMRDELSARIEAAYAQWVMRADLGALAASILSSERRVTVFHDLADTVISKAILDMGIATFARLCEDADMMREDMPRDDDDEDEALDIMPDEAPESPSTIP